MQKQIRPIAFVLIVAYATTFAFGGMDRRFCVQSKVVVSIEPDSDPCCGGRDEGTGSEAALAPVEEWNLVSTRQCPNCINVRQPGFGEHQVVKPREDTSARVLLVIVFLPEIRHVSAFLGETAPTGLPAPPSVAQSLSTIVIRC